MVESCNVELSRDRSTTARPAFRLHVFCIATSIWRGVYLLFFVLSSAGFIVDNVVEYDVWKYYLSLFPTNIISYLSLLFSSCACENVIGCCIELDQSRGNGVRVYKTGLVFRTRPRYLNPLPPVPETNGHHIEILLLVSIVTSSLSLACGSALAYKNICYANWMMADGVMTSYWFHKLVAIARKSTYGVRFGHVSHLSWSTGIDRAWLRHRPTTN